MNEHKVLGEKVFKKMYGLKGNKVRIVGHCITKTL
jgi:hypothetical protein